MLHGQHVKGFNGSTANDTSYTFFEYKYASAANLNANESYLPEVYLSPYNNIGSALPTGAYDCGHLVTTKVTNTFESLQTFQKGIGIPSNSGANIGLYPSHSIYAATSTTATAKAALTLSNSTGTYSGATQLGNRYDDIGIFNGTYPTSSVTAAVHLHNNEVTIGETSGSSKCHLNVYGHAYITDECQALYFNATSDIRAKENLQPISHNMLDIVKQMEVYTFNYKINPEDKSLGLIAQDLQNININGFSLVDNINATGKDGDYMSIHESKLVYILIEAVKELSEKVEKLEKELYASK